MSKKNRIALIERALTLTSGLSTAKASKSRVIRNSVFAAGAFAASTAFAQSPAAVPVTEPVYELEALTTTSEGSSRATNSISATDAQLAIPGASVEKLLSQIPGVNITTRDPFGFYEFGNDIRVRSFGINQVAVTIDDVPMGSNSPRFGLPAGRVTDSENMANIVVSQGAGDVTTPAYEALGGAIKYTTSEPTKEANAELKATIGSFDLSRQFVKVNVGEFAPGWAAWVSASNLKLKTAGIPADSTGQKFESKVTFTKDKFKGMFAYTYNNRDDYDTSSLRYDYYKVMESGNKNAVYSDAVYKAGILGNGTNDTNIILPMYAKYGFSSYNPSTPEYASLTVSQKLNTGIAGSLGDYSDKLRNLGLPTIVDPNLNLGDGVNARYYQWGKNGRQDHFMRGKGELDVTDDLKVTTVGYYQSRDYYGTATIPRSSALSQITGAYNPAAGGNPNRTDIYPVYAYQLAGALVPFGTAGSTPVGWNDTNGNGFFDTGETLNYGSTPTAYSGTHALVGKDSTTAQVLPAIPGHTSRYETFGGDRIGGVAKGDLNLGANKITAGVWYESDSYTAVRPQFNLVGGGFNGPFTNQVLFNNYDRKLDTSIINLFAEDRISLIDNKLNLNFGAKLLYGTREASGYLTTADWRVQSIKNKKATYKDDFLPQVGAAYKLSENYEVFANYAEAFAMPTADVLLGLNNPGIDPEISGETSKNYEVGVRYTGKTFGANFAVFKNDYDNRVGTLSLTTAEQIARNVQNTVGSSYFTNAGAIASKGAEIGAEWKTPIEGFKVAVSGSYLNSEFGDDVRVAYAKWMDQREGTATTAAEKAELADFRKLYKVSDEKITTGSTAGDSVYATALIKGKKQINAPEFAGRIDLSYTWRNWSTNFGTEYRDSVFLNAFNTETIPSYVTNSLNVSWRGSKGTTFEHLTVSGGITNLFDKDILYSTAGGSSPVSVTAFGGSVTPDYGRNFVLTASVKF